MKNIKKSKVKELNENMMNTEHNKMSQGAEFVDKVITFARGENWRRNSGKGKNHRKSK
ncbi:MAG: hypothetical protein UR12_C0018G0008 [candidate division TM6 bacterium GW2011_GWF2_30_66]|jgi:hypothetical protein|nr:MAG: hypothetical protein UR12_C0018G0008 [candidate division TM6 bacterium GW2011_GWF2_30_66]